MNGPSDLTHGSPPGPRSAAAAAAAAAAAEAAGKSSSESPGSKSPTPVPAGSAKVSLVASELVPPLASALQHTMTSSDSSDKETAEAKVKSPMASAREISSVPGVIRRRQVRQAYAHGDFVLNELDGAAAADGAPVLEGFPSVVGNIGALVAKHIIRELELPLIGYFTAPSLPADAIVVDGQPAFPLRVHGDERLVVFYSEFKLPPALIASYVDHILAWAGRHESPHVYTLEAEPETELTTDDGDTIPLAPRRSRSRSRHGAPPIFPGPALPPTGMMAHSIHAIHLMEPDGGSDSYSDSDSPGYGGHESESDDGGSDSDASSHTDHFLTTHEDTARTLSVLAYGPLAKGAISGVAGALLANASVIVAPHVTALLLRASPAYEDGLAAARAIRTLLVLVPSIAQAANTSRMERSASRERKALIKLRIKHAKQEEEQDRIRRLRRSSDAPTTMYM